MAEQPPNINYLERHVNTTFVETRGEQRYVVSIARYDPEEDDG